MTKTRKAFRITSWTVVLRYLAVLFVAAGGLSGVGAQENFSPALDRGINTLRQSQPQIWAQFELFDPAFDWFDFQEESGSSSELSRVTTPRLGIFFPFGNYFSVHYQYNRSNEVVKRQTEPYRLENQADGHDVRFQFPIYNDSRWQLAGEIGARQHQTDTLSIDRFQIGRFSLETLSGAPIVTLHAEDDAWLAGVRANYRWRPNLQFNAGLEYRAVEVQVQFQSPASTDPIIGPLIDEQAPQTTPWNEQHLILNVGLDWQINARFSNAWELRYYSVDRSDYQPKADKTDFDDNIQLDGYLFWHIHDQVSVFGHGRASKHYVLGDRPYLYNTRSNHLFKNPYGTLAIGVVYSFRSL